MSRLKKATRRFFGQRYKVEDLFDPSPGGFNQARSKEILLG